MGAGRSGCHASGLKQEVVVALRTLRDKVLAEQKEKEVTRVTAHTTLTETSGNRTLSSNPVATVVPAYFGVP